MEKRSSHPKKGANENDAGGTFPTNVSSLRGNHGLSSSNVLFVAEKLKEMGMITPEFPEAFARSFRPSPITENIFLGGKSDALNYRHLHQNGVRLILCVSEEVAATVRLNSGSTSNFGKVIVSTTGRGKQTKEQHDFKGFERCRNFSDFPGFVMRDLATTTDQSQVEVGKEKVSSSVLPSSSSGIATVYWACIPVKDVLSTKIDKHFAEAAALLEEMTERGKPAYIGRCLVHCMVGRSRSVSILCAYLTRKLIHHQAQIEDASISTPVQSIKVPITVAVLDYMREKRLTIQPNESFYQQLLAWEQSLQARVEKRRVAEKQMTRAALVDEGSCRQQNQTVDS